MSGTTGGQAGRRGLVAALVAAVTVLVVSVAAVVVLGLAPGSRATAGPAGRGPGATGGMMRGDGGMMDGPRRGGGMMGGTQRGGGMMGDGGLAYGWAGSGPVTLEQARVQAQTWVTKYASGATLDAGVDMPMGYRFTATRAGSVVAVIMVDDDTGSVRGRLWSSAGVSG